MITLTPDERHEQVLWMIANASKMVVQKRPDGDRYSLHMNVSRTKSIHKTASTLTEVVYNAMNSDG